LTLDQEQIIRRKKEQLVAISTDENDLFHYIELPYSIFANDLRRSFEDESTPDMKYLALEIGKTEDTIKGMTISHQRGGKIDTLVRIYRDTTAKEAREVYLAFKKYFPEGKFVLANNNTPLAHKKVKELETIEADAHVYLVLWSQAL
jgi:hypothetical protein